MKKMIFAAITALVPLCGWLLASSGSPPHPADDAGLPAGIVWYGVLDDGIAEAKETGKPILMISAAPQCAGVPGMW